MPRVLVLDVGKLCDRFADEAFQEQMSILGNSSSLRTLFTGAFGAHCIASARCIEAERSCWQRLLAIRRGMGVDHGRRPYGTDVLGTHVV